jgi:hypothetical protein
MKPKYRKLLNLKSKFNLKELLTGFLILNKEWNKSNQCKIKMMAKDKLLRQGLPTKKVSAKSQRPRIHPREAKNPTTCH